MAWLAPEVLRGHCDFNARGAGQGLQNSKTENGNRGSDARL
jgi:hypothetical protein